jgi:hypothetical protein
MVDQPIKRYQFGLIEPCKQSGLLTLGYRLTVIRNDETKEYNRAVPIVADNITERLTASVDNVSIVNLINTVNLVFFPHRSISQLSKRQRNVLMTGICRLNPSYFTPYRLR